MQIFKPLDVDIRGKTLMVFTEPQWNVWLTIPGLLYLLIHICELKEDHFNPIVMILELLFLVFCSILEMLHFWIFFIAGQVYGQRCLWAFL